MGATDLETASELKYSNRITPRTCLWPLSLSLFVTFGLSIGLTFRSNHHCYAGTCGETLFPLQARLHVVVWYMWLSLCTIFLAIRGFRPKLQRTLARHIVERKLPLLNKNLSRGGLLMFLWVICLYGTVISIWWSRLYLYFRERNGSAGITKGSGQLAAIALTGHMCDITMGIVLIPISRHSALASLFQIDVSTTLLIHVLVAYTLFAFVIIHGGIYLSWVPIFNDLPVGLRKAVPVLNPTYLYRETWPGNASSLGIWRASLIFTGCFAALIMLALFVTALPKVRIKHFNLFYFTHVFSIFMVVIICLHASTMFYCTAPGLAMWVLDWSMRLYELRKNVHGDIAKLGRGWYCITLSIPRIRLSGCACRSPLAHFFIHHSESSIRELHPFTTITHLASQHRKTEPSEPNLLIQFLFRTRDNLRPKSNTLFEESPTTPHLLQYFSDRFKQEKSIPWTTKLAALADKKEWTTKSVATDNLSQAEPAHVELSLRLEGPYFTHVEPHCYDVTICLVAGTGISGALAIGTAFNEDVARAQPRRWTRCCIIWSVKEDEEIDLPFVEPRVEGLEVRKFLTGKKRSKVDKEGPGERRIDFEKEIKSLAFPTGTGGGPSIWMYISGPMNFIASAKTACSNVQKAGARLDVYAASWDP